MQRTQFTPQQISGVSLELLHAHYDVRAYADEAPGTFSTEFTGQTLVVSGGKASLGDRRIAHPHFSRTGLHWSEHTADFYWCGVLRFSADRLWCRGHVYAGPNEKEARGYRVYAIMPAQTYKTHVSGGGAMDVTIGVEFVARRRPPRTFVSFDGHDVTSHVDLRHLPGAGLILNVPYRQPAAAAGTRWNPAFPAQGSLRIDLGAGTATGTLSRIDPSNGTRAAKTETWEGTAPKTELKLAEFNGGSPVAGGSSLSTQDLASQDISGADAVSDSLVQQNMNWAIDSTWVQTFTPGTLQPDFSGQISRMTVVDGDCEWYNLRFGPAYLGWGLNNYTGSGAPNPKLNAQQRNRLQYYLNYGLAQEPAYTRQTQALATLAATTACPRLNDYVSNQNGPNGTNWAQALYQYLMQAPVLQNIVESISDDSSSGMANVKDYATILTVLDPSGNYASQFYNAVLAASTAMLSLDTDVSADPNLAAWLGDFIQQFIAANYSPTEPTPTQPTAAYSLAQALNDGVSILGNPAALAMKVAAILTSNRNTIPLNAAEELANELAAAYPNWNNAGTTALGLCTVAGLVFSIYSVFNWESMPPASQVATINNLVGTIGALANSVKGFVTVGAWATEGFGTLLLNGFMAVNGYTLSTFVAATENPLFQAVQWLNTAFNTAKGQIETAGTAAAQFFGTFVQNAMRVIGPVVAAVNFGISVYQFVSDLLSGATTAQTVIDGIQAGLACVVAVCALLQALPVIDVVAGIIGIVATLVGFLLSFISLWLPTEEQEQPADSYFRQFVFPLANQLPDPPAGWKPVLNAA